MRNDGRPYQRRKVGKGTPRPNGQIGIVCEFDPETFQTIRERALAKGVSFAEEVRTLLDWGMESAENARAAAA